MYGYMSDSKSVFTDLLLLISIPFSVSGVVRYNSQLQGLLHISPPHPHLKSYKYSHKTHR